MRPLAPIAAWLLMGTAGVALLCVGCWWASKRAWQPDEVAPGADVARSLPDLHERRKHP